MKIDIKNAPQFVRHLNTLQKINHSLPPFPYDVWDSLVKLEKKANRILTDQCNGDGNEVEQDRHLRLIEKKVLNMLPGLKGHFFLNGDPRGYSLKIDSNFANEIGIYRDFGGYGILVPTF